MPDRDENEESPYHVPLRDLVGKHGYALVRGEDDDSEPDPGAPVAYVAEELTPRPSALTIEGMIYGIGEAAHGAAREGGGSVWVMRLVAAGFLLPFVFIVIARITERF